MKPKRTPREVVEAERRRIALDGVPAAVNALIEVCESKTAPAPAKATAGTSLLRAAGFFEKAGELDSGKQPHEMTPEELQRAIDRLRSGGAPDDDEADVFA